MAQTDELVNAYLLQNPAAAQCYAQGLVNRRALARLILEKNKLPTRQFEALIASLRRARLPPAAQSAHLDFGVQIKDGILIASLAKSREVLRQIERLIPKISYEKNQTFKTVMGTESIKVFLDSRNAGLLKEFFTSRDILYVRKNVSEIALQFPDSARSQKGILAYIASALSVHDIPVEEYLTCSPELLLYVDGAHSLKAYQTLKTLQSPQA